MELQLSFGVSPLGIMVVAKAVNFVFAIITSHFESIRDTVRKLRKRPRHSLSSKHVITLGATFSTSGRERS